MHDPGLAEHDREHQCVRGATAVHRPTVESKSVRRGPKGQSEADDPSSLVPFDARMPLQAAADLLHEPASRRGELLYCDCLATGEQPSELKQELELLVLLDHGYRSSDILFLHLLTLRRWLLVASDWINGHSRSDRGSWQVAVRRCRESRMAPRVAIF